MPTIIFYLATLLIYVTPSIIAHKRKAISRNGIIALNILLGWTFLGWVAALVWSLSSTIDAKLDTQPQARIRTVPSIERLEELFKRGILTKDEFERKRRKALMDEQ